MRKNYFLTVLFILSLLSILWLFNSFVKSAAIAWLLVMVTQNFAKNIEERFANSSIKLLATQNRILAAAVLTIILTLTLFIPLVYLASYAVAKFDYQQLLQLKASILTYISSLTWISDSIKNKMIALLTSYGSEITGEHLKQIWQLVQGSLSGLSKGILNLGFVIVMFFLFHWNRKNIINFFARIIPLPFRQQYYLYSNVSGTLSIVFLTIFSVAITQGIAFAILMLFFNYNPLLLGFFAAITSMIPVFGTALVWVPVVISELVNGNIIGAIIITSYSSFVLAFLIDNFVRLFFLSKISKITKVDYHINEFLLFFAIAAGITTFGFWGVLIGPALIALFIAIAHLVRKQT